MLFQRLLLRNFAVAGLQSNTTYHSERKRLLELYVAAMDVDTGDIAVSSTICVSVRSFLQSRSQDLNDNSRLAFETALHRIVDLTT